MLNSSVKWTALGQANQTNLEHFLYKFFSINTFTNLGHFYKKKFSPLKKNLTIRKKISHNYKKNLTTIKKILTTIKKISILLKNLKSIKKIPQNYEKNQNHKKFLAMKKKILSGYSIKWWDSPELKKVLMRKERHFKAIKCPC